MKNAPPYGRKLCTAVLPCSQLLFLLLPALARLLFRQLISGLLQRLHRFYLFPQLPCVSPSTTSTFFPARASPIPRFTQVVVLPTPPFWFEMAITCAFKSHTSFAGKPYQACISRQLYAPLRSVLNVCHRHTAPPNIHASTPKASCGWLLGSLLAEIK